MDMTIEELYEWAKRNGCEKSVIALMSNNEYGLTEIYPSFDDLDTESDQVDIWF